MADFGDLEINAEIRKIHEESPVRPKLKFFYVEHGLGDVQKVWEKVKDCDIILLESTGITEDLKRQAEEGIAHMTEVPEKILNYKNKDFPTEIIINCIRSRKEFHFVDISKGSAADALIDQSDQKFRDVRILLGMGQPDLALEEYKKYFQLSAQASAIRERTVMRQVMELEEARKYEWQGKTVGIIQGAEHSPTYHAYKKGGPNPDVEKIMPGSPLYVYNPTSEILRRIRLTGNPFIPQMKYKRAFIGDMLVAPELLRNEKPSSASLSQLNKILRNMSDHEVRNYWSELQTLGVNVPLEGRGSPGTPNLIDGKLRRISERILENYS